MKMSATVDITGYWITSGSKPFLKVVKPTPIVKKERTNPKVMVETTTAKISKNPVGETSQKKLPKSIETPLITMLVSKVITITASNNA